MLRIGSRVSVAAFIIAACTSVVLGQADPLQPGQAPPAPRPEPPPSRPVIYVLEGRTELNFNADFDGAPGDVTVTRVGAGFGAGAPLGDRAQLDLQAAYEYSNYDFRDATGFVAGVDSLFEDMHRTHVTAAFSRQESRQFSWSAGGTIGAAGEEGADFSDSIYASVFGGVRYALSETLVVGFGAAVLTRLEDNALFVPVPLLRWQISDQWRLSTDARPGAVLTYLATEELEFSLSGSLDYRDYRLDENGPLPSGVAREFRVPVLLGVRYTPTRQIVLDAAVGYALWQNYMVMDSGGNEVADLDVDPTPVLRFQLSYRF